MVRGELNQNIIMYQFIMVLDEINGIRYSQNELNNGNLTATQLVNYLRISNLQKNFHTLLESLVTAKDPHRFLRWGSFSDLFLISFLRRTD